ncbi:MAG TPA: pirin family protein [Chloroflexia bacterium]|nr:pirin family protein [Chloroflexia bacterium]
MIAVRKADERGHFNHGWLNTYHTFSFADYYDPKFMGFRHLRVINEDRVVPGEGFGTHPHRDMEIISYVLEGGLAHRDSMGNGSTIKPGEVQRMTAGTGITHSEFNHSEDELVHFLQIWITPNARGLTPGYEQKFYPEAEKLGKLRLVASPDGKDGSVAINQDVQLYATLLNQGDTVEYKLKPERYSWVQVVRGEVELNGRTLQAGDGAALSQEEVITLSGKSDARAEVLLFDLA